MSALRHRTALLIIAADPTAASLRSPHSPSTTDGSNRTALTAFAFDGTLVALA